jgi:hypothetical protein
MSSYPPPVDRLLLLGETTFGAPWPDFSAEFGLGPEHVPDLIRLASDEELYEADWPEEDEEPRPELWAPIHARRALGHLRAVSAVRPLLDAMDRFGEYDDYWTEELPDILAMMGPEAIPALAGKLDHKEGDDFSRSAAAGALTGISRAHPERRDEIIGLMVGRLEQKDPIDATLNGSIVAELLDLNAVEAAPAIEAAFEADAIDESIAGGWEDVRYELGLGPKPIYHSPPTGSFRAPRPLLTPYDPDRKRPDLKKLQKKRKAEKKARKQNRKRR